MSEIDKLEKKIRKKSDRHSGKLYKEFMFRMAEIKGNCKHGETHWIQEITKEGKFKWPLFKRCYLCGSNIDMLEAEPEFIEQLLTTFDKACEEKKLLTTPIKGVG